MGSSVVISGNEVIGNLDSRIKDYGELDSFVASVILRNTPTRTSVKTAEIYQKAASEIIKLYKILNSAGAILEWKYREAIGKIRKTEIGLAEYLLRNQWRIEDADQIIPEADTKRNDNYQPFIYKGLTSMISLENAANDMEVMGFEIAALILDGDSKPIDLEVADIYRTEAKAIRKTYSILSGAGGYDLKKYRSLVKMAKNIEVRLSYQILDALYSDFSEDCDAIMRVHNEVQSLDELRFAREYRSRLRRMFTLYNEIKQLGFENVLQDYELEKMADAYLHLDKIVMLNRPIKVNPN